MALPGERRPPIRVIAISVGLTALVLSAAGGGVLYGMQHPARAIASLGASPNASSPAPAVKLTPSAQPTAGFNPYALAADFGKLERAETAGLAAAEAAYKASPQTQADFKVDWLAKAKTEEDFATGLESLTFPPAMLADANAYIEAVSELGSAMRAYGSCETLTDCNSEQALAQSAVSKAQGTYDVLNGDIKRALAAS